MQEPEDINEPKGQEEGKGTEEPKPEPITEPQGTDPKPEPKGDPDEEGSLKDRHGQNAISKGKYERDMKAKDAKIAELEAQIEEAAKTKEGRDELLAKIEELKAGQSETRTEYELRLAGCRDGNAVKAAKALLDDYEGDITKLKTSCPYLFEAKKTGSTGGKPTGAPNNIEDAIERAFAK